MADFFTRLAERTLGVAPVAQPMIATMFAPGLTMAGSFLGDGTLTVEDEELEITSTQSARQAFPRHAQLLRSAQPPQSLPSTASQPPQSLPSTASQHPQSPVTPKQPARQDHAHHAVPEPQHDTVLQSQQQIVPQPQRQAEPHHHVVARPLEREENEIPHTRSREHIAPIAPHSEEQSAIQYTNTGTAIGRGELQQLTSSLNGRLKLAPTDHVPTNVGVEGEIMVREGGLLKLSPTNHAPANHAPADVGARSDIVRQKSSEQFAIPTATIYPQDWLSEMVSERIQETHVLNPLVSGREERSEDIEQSLVPHRQHIALEPYTTLPEPQTKSAFANEDKGGISRTQPEVTASLTDQLSTRQHMVLPAAEEASSVPTVRVTIGRIDVRAITQTAPAPRPKPGRSGPTLSLEAYSRQRKGGEQ